MNFLYGTYGFDLYSIFLLFIGVLFNNFKYTRIIALVLFIYVIYRAFSKNTYKRSQELYKFTSFVNNKILYRFNKRLPNIPSSSLYYIPQSFKFMFGQIKESLKYKIIKCPNCNQKLRLPRGKKKIIVTCKRCSCEFKART